ncbi:nucleotidyltransferase domain-containing protein [Candidatus Pacearchaeota archaeon]|nr:nucleotidyltransferase domain-containing protein [Candidatus Pacearchaeota archaeon]
MKIKEEVLKTIKEIEKEEHIKVLFLIESGSRAWGWESEDSDYDVRGVYVQDYLVIEDIKEHIDKKKGNLDITLWDFRKFLRLMKNSNPSVWEWLSSDIIYLENPLRKKLKNIFNKDFNSLKLKSHYCSMAKQNFHKYINEIGDSANLKKYVYVLRSIACILWIEKNKTAPPKNYKEVIGLFPKEIRLFFEKIVKEKRKSESLTGKRNKEVEKYIVSFFDKRFEKDKDKFDINELNKIFKEQLK